MKMTLLALPVHGEGEEGLWCPRRKPGSVLGEFGVRGGDDPAAPPHEGEARRGLWFPRRKPGSFSGGVLGV